MENFSNKSDNLKERERIAKQNYEESKDFCFRAMWDFVKIQDNYIKLMEEIKEEWISLIKKNNT